MGDTHATRSGALAHFDSFETQELLDLSYGEQLSWCEAFAATVPNVWDDGSMDASWTPDED